MVGRSLLDKRLHSFLHSLCIIQGIKNSPLQGYPLSHRQVLVLFDRLLSSKEGRQRPISDLLGNVDDLRVKISSREDFADQTHFIGPLCVNEFRGKDVSVSIYFSSNSGKSKYHWFYL